MMEDKKRRHIYIDESSNELWVKEQKEKRERFKKMFYDSIKISKKAAKDLEKILGKPFSEIFPYRYSKEAEELKKYYGI